MIPQDPPLEALASWARSRYSLHWPLRACVLKFIKSYQGRPGEPRPCVGRAALMRSLDQWLLQGQERLRLLSGAAGRGKSALLLHWMGRLIQREPRIALLYLPISIRFNTAHETAGVQLLFAALCDVCSELKERLPQQPEAQDYLQGIQSAWQQLALRPGEVFLLVVDGLDEGINHWFIKRQLLPPELPPNLHVLIAARHKPGHADGMAWLRDLKCCDRASEHQVVEIRTLEKEAMAEAVIQLGLPLHTLAERQAFTENLYRLTDDGDPLLLTLWLAQIWRQRDAVPDLNPEALARLAPGFGEYYKLWMKEQHCLWDAMGLDVHPDDFAQVMHVLATAQGPMPLGDLIEVLGHLHSLARWEQQELSAVLGTARRLVIADDTGYVLVHPRLAQYFQEDLEADPSKHEAVCRSFLMWGARTVLRLNSGELQPEECPDYLLTHYVAVHLATGDGPQVLAEYHLPLLRQGWPKAWYAHEGAWHGYLNDLQQLAGRLQASNQEALRAGHPSRMRLSAEVRCALLAGSIRSLIGNLPSELLESLARAGVWSLARAARVARQYEPCEQVQTLTALAAVATDKGEPAAAQSLLQEALEMATALRDPAARADALSNVASQLQGEAQRTLFQQALRAVGAIQCEERRAAELSSLVARLRADNALLEQALEAATAIQDTYHRARALSGVAELLREQAKDPVLQQAMQAAATIQDAWQRAEILTSVAAQLQGDNTLMQQALEAARGIRDGYNRARALSGVAAKLPEEVKDAVLQQALQAAATIQLEWERAEVLTNVAAQLHGDAQRAAVEQAAAAAGAIEDMEDRCCHIRALCTLAAQLHGDAQRTVLHQALTKATAIQDEGGRACALSMVAAQLQADSSLLPRVLEAIAAMEGAHHRACPLSAVAAQLQGEDSQRLVREALEAAAQQGDKWLHAQTLNEMAAQLRDEARRSLVQPLLAAAEALDYEYQLAMILHTVVPELQGERALLQRALKIAATIQNPSTRAQIAVSIAAQLQSDGALWQQTIELVASIHDASEQVCALCAVAAQLHGECRRTALQQALVVTGTIEDSGEREKTLKPVLAQLHGEGALLQQALGVATAIQAADARASALSVVADHLQGDDRRSVLQQAVTAAAGIRDEHHRATALCVVAAHCQADTTILPPLLRAAATIKDGNDRVWTLCAVAAQLQGEAQQAVLRQALMAAAAIEYGLLRAYALCDVATQLQGKAQRSVVQQALVAAATIQGDWRCERLLRHLAPHLQGDSTLLQRALDIATAISLPHIDNHRASALRTVVARLPGDSPLLPQALAAVRGIADDGRRADVLSDLAAQLQGETQRTVVQEALAAAAAIQDAHDRASALRAVGPHLQGDTALLQRWLEEAAKIEDPSERAGALCVLAGHLEGDTQRTVLEEGLQAASVIRDAARRASTLRTMAEQLQGEPRQTVLQQALLAAVTIQDDGQRADTLLALTGHWPQCPEIYALCLKEALEVATPDYVRFINCATLVRKNPSFLTYDVWHNLLSRSGLTRPLLLYLIDDLTWCAVTLTGRTEEADEVAKAIHEVCGWFP